MGTSRQRFALYRPASNVVVSAAAATVFALRAITSGSGIGSLSGPAWTVVYALLALGFLFRCFDRVAVTQSSITSYRVGIPKRLVASSVHQFDVVEQNAKWVRLYAQTADGEQVHVTSERRSAAGQARMRQLWDQLHSILGAQLQPLTPEAAAVAARRAPAPVDTTNRRCIRSGCSDYFVQVATPLCPACGSRTQRIAG